MRIRTPFRLLHLPLLVIREVFEFATTYELFAHSTLSKRAKQIVKLVSSHRKFDLYIDLNRNYCLRLMTSPKDCLTIESQCYEIKYRAVELKLNGSVVQAGINFDDMSSNSDILVFWKNKTQGLRSVLQILLETFKIGFFELNNSDTDGPCLTELATPLRALRPIDKLYDIRRTHYNFDEIMSFMPTKHLLIQYPKMKYKQFIALFKIWMEGNAAQEVSLCICPKLMSIRPLALLVEGRPEVTEKNGCILFELVRSDGLLGCVIAHKRMNIVQFRDPYY